MIFSLRNAAPATLLLGLVAGPVIAAGPTSKVAPKPPASAPSTAPKSGGVSKVPATTTTVSVRLVGNYYGLGSTAASVASGLSTLTYDATQTSRTMTLTTSNVNLPDGTQLHVDLSSDAIYQPTAYYPIYATQAAGSLTLVGHGASESISTADGLAVPLFGTTGTILVTAYSADGVRLGTVLSGSYAPLANGNKPGGRP